MSKRKLERLLNLTLCLMATSRYLTVREVAELVDGYEPGNTADSEIAFRRMFERDKEELRELGVPLETGTPRTYDEEIGYRIPRRDYALPDLHLDADEVAALGLAARLWSSASLATASAGALRKLRAAGIDLQAGPAGLEPRVDVTEPAFDPCLAAVREGRAVRFRYRRPGVAAAMEREVEPWGVVSWRGRWYLVGFDRGREGTRVFRLGRVEGTVTAFGPAGAVSRPEGIDLTAVVESAEPRDLPEQQARLRLRPGTGWALRRAYPPQGPAGDGGTRDTDDEIVVSFRDVERLADQLVGLGADVEVLGPDEVRAVVRRRLQAALAAHEPNAGAGPAGTGPAGAGPAGTGLAGTGPTE
ncbi:MAG TPA: WYL domain-containing protein [Frankiaceae bacterium]|nr:WYL domain-containing protein [Frankiaceae bacterium]